MQIQWDDSQPIYLQLRDRVQNMILEGNLAEGEALPSVRNVSAEYQLNPITVSKAYQLLVDDQLAEKKRGLGMFVVDGAKNKLLQQERELFLNTELPALLRKLKRLNITREELLDALDKEESDNG
ncbi:GntR family transcriptional regulator [Kangiella geojedonensis]|uniref:GntR family transcriptional regulator n=1 Tax=Kangiella geojedonensis TaxID=914150 RepID=A0A0F6RBF9_9GAMM|nr:GntR family transcriptional regulator [Kangiella geojedonensis]AKE51523.1 GntR family transcriptional regulator [Kangiella geojedonensis]